MRKMVAAVIYKHSVRQPVDKYLILKRKLNWKGWEFVKGEVEKETSRAAVLREIREELRINARVIAKLPEEIIYRHEEIRGHTTSKLTAFLVEYVSGTIRLSFEHSAFKWTTAKIAGRLLTYDNNKTFLRLANSYIRKRTASEKKELIERLSKKHITHLSFAGGKIKLKYDGKMLSNNAVKKTVKVVGDWSRKKNIVYYDKNLSADGVLPILVHETVEKHVAQKYGLDVDTEAHKIAQAVEKEFVADKRWAAVQKDVTRAWVKANEMKVGDAKFY